MARDYFAILGLTPGRHDPREITRHFNARHNGCRRNSSIRPSTLNRGGRRLLNTPKNSV